MMWSNRVWWVIVEGVEMAHVLVRQEGTPGSLLQACFESLGIEWRRTPEALCIVAGMCHGAAWTAHACNMVLCAAKRKDKKGKKGKDPRGSDKV